MFASTRFSSHSFDICRGGRRANHVVARAPVGEVFPRVVDDVRGADRAHQLDVSGAAHPGDLRAPNAAAICTA
jgi:hypothetical protein